MHFKMNLHRYKPTWNWLPYLLLLPLMWLFWTTSVSTSWARIASLQTIEPYAMAVHEQLMRNFAETGSFSQTIHRGYDDAWTWSGHRALTLPIVGWIYGWNPSALWLSKIMIGWFVFGALGAGGIAMRHLQSHWGFLWGGAVYLLMPATMALSLQDYQDLCMALPCLVLAWNLLERGKWYWTVLAIFLAIAPREETVPMAFFCAVMARPMLEGVWLRRAHAMNVGIAIALIAFYAWWANAYFPLNNGGHDMPLQNAMGSLGHERIFLEGWVYHTRFYALVFLPIGVLSYFAPLVGLPAVALCLLHMSVPDGHGVDRSWSGHCHHMAPAVAFSCISAIIGGSRLANWLSIERFGRWKGLLPTILLIGTISWSGWWWVQWADYYNLILTSTVQEPEWEHPAWKLKEYLKEDEILVVNKNTALVASDQVRSYTLDESLYGKERRKGLGVADCAIIDRRRSDILQRVMTMSPTLRAEEEQFQMWCWEKNTVDRFVMNQSRFKPAEPYTGPYKKGSDIPGTAPRESKIATPMGSFPVLNLRDWKIE